MDLREFPRREKKIGVKWVNKAKLNKLVEVEKYKPHLVAKGFAQEYRVD